MSGLCIYIAKIIRYIKNIKKYAETGVKITMNDIRKKASEITKQLTLKEKIGQITQIQAGYKCYNIADDGSIEFTDEFKNTIKEYGGIGAISGILRADPWSGRHYGTGIEKARRGEVANMLQEYIENNTRMKIPAMIEIEASHGMQSLGSVMYPTGLSNAASFNPELYGQMMEEIGREIEASGNHIAFVTLIDLARDPRWGRCEECLGEDPYLASRMAEHAVKNLKKSNVLACAKHFAGAGNCEGGINCAEIHMGKREFEENALSTAKACVKAGCDMIMVSYNGVDGVPVHANYELLTEFLKRKSGFEGIVISDGGGCGSTANSLGISLEDAAILCIKAGIDLSLADSACFTRLEHAVTSGKLDVSYIDNACTRVLEKKLELNLFEKRYVDNNAAVEFNLDGHCEKIAYNLAAESITMIKNDGLLPISKNTRLAVIGENAGDIYHILGDYTSERLKCEGSSIKDAISRKFTDVVYSEGWRFNGGGDFNKAVETAKQADVIVFCAGGTSRRDFEAKYLDNGAVSKTKNYMDCGEGCDLASLRLCSEQRELFYQLKTLGKPVVSIVVMGRGYVLTDIVENSDAVLSVWYPGQEGGHALADVLIGKINPSGRLPVTLPTSAYVLPVCHDAFFNAGRYFDCENPVLFPFGYGLSYSEFKYSELLCNAEKDGIRVEFFIENISEIAGKEVAQVYINVLGDSVKHKRHKLAGFCKLALKPWEKKKAEFLISYDDIGFETPISPKAEISVGVLGYEKFEKITVDCSGRV